MEYLSESQIRNQLGMSVSLSLSDNFMVGYKSGQQSLESLIEFKSAVFNREYFVLGDLVVLDIYL